MENTEIKMKLKQMLVDRLNLDVAPDDIADTEPLFRGVAPTSLEGLNLDSIEALEIVIGLERTFKVKVRSTEYRQEFYSVQTLANFVGRLLANAPPPADQS